MDRRLDDIAGKHIAACQCLEDEPSRIVSLRKMSLVGARTSLDHSIAAVHVDETSEVRSNQDEPAAWRAGQTASPS
jgi:hypothetical protein